MFILR